MCKVYTGYHDTSEIEHGLCTCTVENPLAKAQGLSLCTVAQTMLYLSLVQAISRNSDYCKNSKQLRHLDYHIFSAIRRVFCSSRIITKSVL